MTGRPVVRPLAFGVLLVGFVPGHPDIIAIGVGSEAGVVCAAQLPLP